MVGKSIHSGGTTMSTILTELSGPEPLGLCSASDDDRRRLAFAANQETWASQEAILSRLSWTEDRQAGQNT
jgi:hypothetical protein